MGRRKTGLNKSLPRGLRVRKGYYSYRNPVDGQEVGLGRDRREAIKHAILTNVSVGTVGRRERAPDLLSEAEIASAAVPVKAMCGVYFLLSGAQIVYVGKSGNVHYRVGEHIAKRFYDFDRVHILACNATDVDHLEALYIATYRPKYNRDMRIALIGKQADSMALT